MSLADKDVIRVIDSKIADTRREQERLRRAAELLPTVEANLAALLRTKSLLGGQEPEDILAAPDHIKQAGGAAPGSIGTLSTEALREAGKPLHVNELMSKLHAKGSRVARHTLVGTLARYAKEGRLRRTAPSIYALPIESLPR